MTARDPMPRALLHRAELDHLDLVEGPIYVVGHKSPDADTVCSAIAYAHLLRVLGHDARATVPGAINRESAFILSSAGVELPPTLTDPAGKNVALVDHSEYSQAIDGMEEAHVVCVIDHHNAGSLTTQNQLVYDARPLGSTATLIWLRYLDYDVELDRHMAMLLLGAVLSDTKNLIAGTTTAADVAAVGELASIAGLEDVEAFYDGMFRARLSLEGMTDNQIYCKDYKEYEVAGTPYCIGCVDVYDEEVARSLVGRMVAEMRRFAPTRGMKLMYAKLSAMHDDVSFTYLVPGNEASCEVARRAFGMRATFDGTLFVFKPHVSRKRDVVPALREALVR